MEQFKIENFERNNTHASFPIYRKVLGEELDFLRSNLFDKICGPENKSVLGLMERISLLSGFVDLFNAEGLNFNLNDVLTFFSIEPCEEVFVNWYKFDDIDAFLYLDLVDFFCDIWYPSVDDIEIFDISLDWVISVRHDGAVYVLKG